VRYGVVAPIPSPIPKKGDADTLFGYEWAYPALEYSPL
jgi:hypothetical protein